MSAAHRIRVSLRLLSLLALALAGVGLAGATGRFSQPVAARALSPACTGLTFTTSPASSQPQGTQVTITGSATGCPDPGPLYEYWVLPPGGSYQLVQSWTTGSATWNTTGDAPGSWWITVWAKDADSTTQSYDVDAGAAYGLTAACPSVTLSVTPASPQPDGALVTLTATAQNCSDPNPLYRYYVQTAPNTYQLIQAWTTGTATWNTAGLTPGAYWLIVWAKDASSLTQSFDSDAGQSDTLNVTTAPSAPTLTSPGNNATNVGTTPTLTWTVPSSGYTAGSTSFMVTIWDPFGSAGFPKSFNAGTSSSTSSVSWAVPSSANLSGATYQWSVAACNGQACSAYAPFFSFSTAATPAAPQQSAPANGATNVSLTPQLAWSSVSGATDYKVSIWDPYALPDGHLLAVLDVGNASTVANVPAAEGLYYSQQYFWNVTSCTGTPPNQSCSNYNSVWYSFTTAALTQPSPGGVTFNPVFNVSFATPPIGWSYSPQSGPPPSGGAATTTVTSVSVVADSGSTALALSYALAATPFQVCCCRFAPDTAPSVCGQAAPAGLRPRYTSLT